MQGKRQGFTVPIHKMSFDDGMFFARQVGYIDYVDARMWANALGNHAENSGEPIMAVVDMLEVDRLCPTVIEVFETVLDKANVLGIVLVTGASIPVFTSHRIAPQYSSIPVRK